MNVFQRWAARERSKPQPVAGGCLACGQCCEVFGRHLRASKADLERWRRLGREDLLRGVNRLGWLWINPETGRPHARCPYLQRRDEETAFCAIHDVKPDMCRDYPTLAHGRRCLRGVFLALPLLIFDLLTELPVLVCGGLCLT